MPIESTDAQLVPLVCEMYRSYEIKQTEFGWFNIRRQSFSVASFYTIQEARQAIDATYKEAP